MIFLAQRRWNAYRIRHGLEGIHFASKVGTKAYLLSVYLLIIEAKLKYELFIVLKRYSIAYLLLKTFSF